MKNIASARPTLADSSDGLPAPQRQWAIFTLVLGIAMAVLDGSIVNVALPTIAKELGASPAAAIWVVNAYQLAVIATLLPLASLGDTIGYRTISLSGLLIFTLASLACAMADSLATLTAARTLQGLGAAGVMSVNAALVRFIYPQRRLGRGIGIIALVVALSAAAGPTVAAAILAVADWHWLFAINVPVGIAALAIGVRALPATRRSPHPFDVISAILNALTFGLVISGIDGVGHGAPWPSVAARIGAGLLFGALLVRRQFKLPSPLLPVDLLRIPLFALSVSTSTCSFAAQMLAYVSLPFYLHDVLGRSAVETGLLMTPWPLLVGVAAPLAGRLADRYPAGLLGGIGLAVFAVGLSLLALLPAAPADADIAWRMAVCGFGFGLFQSPNNRTIMNSAPRERSGGASGMLGTARLAGQTLGAALVALIFGVTASSSVTIALTLAAGFAAVAAVISSLRLLAPTNP
ncbi:MAG TPA: MFS transporter [Gammaproteobacteria bacterium]|nr:MFS transporter [Gammaproteobacteria bacterium]